MSSTAEELASQSEHLQGTIEFFRVGGNDDTRSIAMTGAGPKAYRMAKFGHLPHEGQKAQRTVTVGAETVVKKTGVALDMGNGGRDAEDDEFEKF